MAKKLYPKDRLWVFLAILFGLIGLLIITSWALGFPFFRNPPLKPQISNLASRSLSVSWLTAKEARGCVLYSRYKLPVALSSLINLRVPFFTGIECNQTVNKTRVHQVSLKGLEPDLPYYYRIKNGLKLYKAGLPNMKTLAVADIPLTLPHNVYGQVKLNDRTTAATDVLVYLLAKDESRYSALTNEQGNWLISLPFPVKEAIRIIVEAGALGRQEDTLKPAQLQPAKTIVLD